jgi:8-oxo-dGTP diphosphatase
LLVLPTSGPIFRLLLRIWRDVPFPDSVRDWILRRLNSSFMVGAMALIQDDKGRILVLEHTYRKKTPWGLPGGWLHADESPERGLRREVFEETGLDVSVDALLAADFFPGPQLDLIYRCSVLSGSYKPSDETSAHRWADPEALPELLPNQLALLARAGIIHQV